MSSRIIKKIKKLYDIDFRRVLLYNKLKMKGAEIMIKTDIKVPFSYSSDDIYSALSLHIPVSREELREMKIVKKSLNASDKGNIHYDLTVAISLSQDPFPIQGLLCLQTNFKILF